MPPDTTLLAALFLVVGSLYASVGHAGASGYLAVMALMGVAPESMRSTALAVNVVVATIAFSHYAAAGHFSWRFLLPFAITSVPAAFVGGAIELPADWLRLAIGAVLAFSAIRMARTSLRPAATPRSVRDPAFATKLLAGAAIGFAAGLTGTGGGIFLSPLILLCGWAEPKRTAATASLFILVNSLSGLGGLVQAGWAPTIDLLPLAIAAGIGGFAGAFMGSRKATSRTLNFLLAAVLAVAASKLLVGGLAAIADRGSSRSELDDALPDRNVLLHPIDEGTERREAFGAMGGSHLACEGDLADADPTAAVKDHDRADARPARLLAGDRLEQATSHRFVDLVVDRREALTVLESADDALEPDAAADALAIVRLARRLGERSARHRSGHDLHGDPAHPPPTSAMSATSSVDAITVPGAAKAWFTARRAEPIANSSCGYCAAIASSTPAAVGPLPPHGTSHSMPIRSHPAAWEAGPKRSTSTRIGAV